MSSQAQNTARSHSHIQKVRDNRESVQKQVQQILGWTDLEYAELQESFGLDYLKINYGILSKVSHKLPASKVFWSWWRLHWMRKDVEFLDMIHLVFSNEYVAYYREIHEPANLSYYLNGSVISGVIKENTQSQSAQISQHLQGILAMVANVYGVTVEAIKSPYRPTELVDPRHMFCLVSKTIYPGLNEKAIAKEINRERSTVSTSIVRMRDFIKVNRTNREAYIKILTSLGHEDKIEPFAS